VCKQRNVLERLPKECVSQTAAIMKAAFYGELKVKPVQIEFKR